MDEPAASPDLKLTPYWWEAAPRPEAGPPKAPKEADVCVVGAGYAGLSAALVLARAGRSVVVFDAMRAGEGASSRNGGLCSGNVKLPFGDMIERFGLDLAKAIYGEGVAARQFLARLIEDEAIDCDFKMVGRFTGANTRAAYDKMGREADLMNRHIDVDVEMVAKADQHRELGTDFYFGGQVRADIGGLHPGLLHQGMLDRAVEAGAAVIAETAVTRIDRADNGFRIETAAGTLAAADVIVATNGYTDAALPWLRRRVIPIPSQIIATEPLDRATLDRLMPKRRMCGDTRNLYNYYRPSPDDTRIVFGGRRGADTDDPRRKCAHLYANMVEIFPDLEGIGLTHSWWGYTGYSFDFLPHVAVHDGIHYATAFCGSGVVWAPWLGRKAALRVLGEAEAASAFDAFAFNGRPLYNGRPWFLPLVIGWYGLKDRLGKSRA